jgi:rod shape-determining protein MreC
MRSPEVDTTRANLIVLIVLLVVAIGLTTVYFREGDAGPLHRARSGVLAVAAPLQQGGQVLTWPFRSLGDFIGGLSVSRSDISQLRDQNTQLRKRVSDLQDQQLENARLSALVQLKQAVRLPSTGARVIGRPTSSWEGSLVIDKGTADGLKMGMPVVAAQGLVGQIVEVAPNASKVQLISDRRSGVAVVVQRTRAPGIVRGSLEGSLSLDFVDRGTKPTIGDVVVSSGMGGVFPKGIIVGDVTAVHDQRDKPFPLLTITSRVPVEDVEEVLVLTSPMPGSELAK